MHHALLHMSMTLQLLLLDSSESSGQQPSTGPLWSSQCGQPALAALPARVSCPVCHAHYSQHVWRQHSEMGRTTMPMPMDTPM